MIFNENLINNISIIYKVYYCNNDDDTIKIFIFRYTNEDEYAEQFAEYIVHELVGNTGFIRNILTYTICNEDTNTYKKIKEEIFNYLRDNTFFLSGIIVVRSFSTYSNKFNSIWKPFDNTYSNKFNSIWKPFDNTYNIFEPLEISYCNKFGKAIIDTKANNTKKTNKFMNYDI